MRIRPITIYKAYGWAWTFTLFLQLLDIYVDATHTGLRTGVYVVSLYTNQYGENYPELALLILGLPAIALNFYDWIIVTFKPKAKT